MPKLDRRVDAYIAKSADFARPILDHLRKLVHVGCPLVEETIKWQFPVFMHHGILCSMAAFQQHCTFGFWKHALILDENPGLQARPKAAMGQLGRITSISDLPSDKVLLAYLKRAVQLNEAGIKVPRAPRPRRKKALIIPPVLASALQRNQPARKTFESFSPSHQREYIEWIAEAKREATRTKRLATAISWLAAGKSRNWKYQNC